MTKPYVTTTSISNSTSKAISSSTPLPSKTNNGLGQYGTTGDYAVYLDSMLDHLGRVHREACIRYYSRRLSEMGYGA